MEKYINDINICKETLEKMMAIYIGNEDLSICSDQLYEQMNSLEKRIDDLIYLNKNFKVKFSNDLLDLVCGIESESFYKGFEVGTAIVKYLFSQETPIISFMNRPPKRKEEQPTETAELTDTDKQLIEYIKEKLPLVTEKNKSRLQAQIEVYSEPEYRYM